MTGPVAGGTDRGPETPPIFWIDALRVAAALAVVFLHVAAEPVVFVKNRDAPIWWIGNLIDSATRWCVPIFIMLSGALLLAPREESTRAFYRRRVRRIALPLAAWTLAYIAFYAMRRGTPSWAWIGEKILYGRPEYHMWYVYMTLGLYLLTPLLRRFTAWAERPWQVGACVALMGYAVVHDLLFSFGYVPMFRSVFTMFIPYLGYFLAGHVLIRHPPRIPSSVLWGTVAVCIATIAAGTRVLMGRYGPYPAGLYLYEYLAPPVIAMSLAVFLLGMRLPRPDPSSSAARFLRDASLATLGIYLIHPMWIKLLREQGLATVPLGLFGVPIVASLVIALSYLVVSALRRTPVLRQTV